MMSWVDLIPRVHATKLKLDLKIQQLEKVPPLSSISGWLSTMQIIMCMNLTNETPVTFRDSDSLNPQVIICIVDNQPEIDSTNIKNFSQDFTHDIFT